MEEQKTKNSKNKLLEFFQYKVDIYDYMILFLLILNVASSLFYGFGINSLISVLIALLTAVISDFIIQFIKSKQFIFPKSSVISGLFIGGILAQNLKWYVYVIAALIAVLSKHIIKLKNKHIFNPANLGILLVSTIFGAVHSWWLSSPIILVLLFGIFVVYRMKRFDLILTFLLTFYIVDFIFELINGAGMSSLYYTAINSGVLIFFACFMLLEPKTTPLLRKRRIFYGIFVALLYFVIDKINPIHSLPLALAVGNIFVFAVNIANLKKK